MSEAKESAVYLGVFRGEFEIAETVLKSLYGKVERMQYGNSGFDFVCNGNKIDVKTSCISHDKRWNSDRWSYSIKKNEIADMFLLIAYESRTSLNVMHIWLVEASKVNDLVALKISNNEKTLRKWKKYELELIL